MEERKFATVLFADFVGSTAIGASHDPEVVRASFGSIFARMRDILVRHGGTVEKFIGDAVMAVFGVPIAHEDDALRAVHAAFALRQELASAIPGSTLPVALRVGISTGEVVAGTAAHSDFLVTGTTVNIAARLQAAAEPGQIVVGPVTRELTSSRIRYEEQRDVPAKGVGTVGASLALEIRTEVAHPQRTTRLVDRESELRALADAYEAVKKERRPQLVTVYGAPGVGKSRLVSEFIARHPLSSVRVGRCVPYGDGVTLPPLQSIVRTEAGIVRADSVEEARRKLRGLCERAFPTTEEARRVFDRLALLSGVAGARDLAADVPQDSLAQELDWALRRLLEARSADGALVLLFEDIQWAEPALLDTIDHLVDWTRGGVLILCLARPEFLQRREAWASGRPERAALQIAPLSASDTQGLVASMLPKEHSGALDAIVKRCEGNPFYAEELVRLLVTTGESLSAVPATLQGLIAARLDASAPGVKALLQRAAVVGPVFWVDALSELGADNSLWTHLADAVRQEFVVELSTRGPGGGSAYRFAHALTRDVAYASLAKAERASLHDRLSRWLERSIKGRAADDLETIASHAERAYAFASEVRAPRMLELARRAFELVLAAARAADARADVQRAESLFQRAIALGAVTDADPRALLEAKARVAIARLRRENSADALGEVRRVLEEARAGGTSEILAALLRWSAMYAPYASPNETSSLYAEAIGVARALGDPSILAAALRASARPATARGALGDARLLLVEAQEMISGDQAVVRARVLLDLAGNSIDRGAFSEALRYIQDAQPDDLVGNVLARRKDAELWYASGDVGRAAPRADAALDAARELGSPLAIADAAVVQGAVLRELGDVRRSRTLLEDAFAAARARAPAGTLWRLNAELARTALAMGDIERARSCVAALEGSPQMETAAVAVAHDTAAVLAATEGNVDVAMQRFERAETLLRSTELGLLLTLVRLDHARALIAAGRAAEAEPLLIAVRDFFVDPLASSRRSEVVRMLSG